MTVSGLKPIIPWTIDTHLQYLIGNTIEDHSRIANLSRFPPTTCSSMATSSGMSQLAEMYRPPSQVRFLLVRKASE